MLFQWPKLTASILLAGTAALAHLAPPVVVERAAAPPPCAVTEPVIPEPVATIRAAPAPEAVPRLDPAATAPHTERLLKQAQSHMLAGEHAVAREKLERCLRLDPRHAQCHRTLGVLYASTGRPRASLAHYRRYLELAPDARDARLVRAIIERAERLFYPKP